MQDPGHPSPGLITKLAFCPDLLWPWILGGSTWYPRAAKGLGPLVAIAGYPSMYVLRPQAQAAGVHRCPSPPAKADTRSDVTSCCHPKAPFPAGSFWKFKISVTRPLSRLCGTEWLPAVVTGVPQTQNSQSLCGAWLPGEAFLLKAWFPFISLFPPGILEPPGQGSRWMHALNQGF